MKKIVITGGNKGIGLSIALYFAERDWSVFVGSRSTFIGEHRNITHIPTDVRIEDDVQKLASVAAGSEKRIDVWVNNAGFSEWKSINDINDEFLSNMLDTNLKGAFWGCKSAQQYMVNGGSIINISSIAGKRGTANNSAYVASKFAMNGLTQSLSKELGPKGIRVNGLCPVLIATDGLLEALEKPGAPGYPDSKKFLDTFTQDQTALKRLPTANEVASMCFMLSSDLTSAVTGQNINVDCGVLPQ